MSDEQKSYMSELSQEELASFISSYTQNNNATYNHITFPESATASYILSNNTCSTTSVGSCYLSVNVTLLLTEETLGTHSFNWPIRQTLNLTEQTAPYSIGTAILVEANSTNADTGEIQYALLGTITATMDDLNVNDYHSDDVD